MDLKPKCIFSFFVIRRLLRGLLQAEKHVQLKRYPNVKNQLTTTGQWLWLSWKSGCFQLQRSVVSIQTLAKNILNIYCQLSLKVENIEKEANFKKIN